MMASNDTQDQSTPLNAEEEEEIINDNDEAEKEEQKSASEEIQRDEIMEASKVDHPKNDDSCLVEIKSEPDVVPDITIKPPPKKKSVARYKKGLNKGLPVRCVKKSKDVLPLDTNGLCNFMTFGWLSSIMWSIHKKGIKAVKNMKITESESAEVNVLRIERCWEEELQANGPEKASFGKAVFQSFKTRVLIGTFVSLLSAFFSLANPMLVIRYFLEYLDEGEVSIQSGIVYVVLLTAIILLKALTDGFFWTLNIEAAVRIKNGYLGLLFKKIVHVKALKEKSVGDVVNFLSNDGLRIWYGIIMGPYIIGGPMILIMSCVYSIFYLGPWALLAWLVIIGFYPFALGLAKKSMDFRAESIKITDKRVAFTSELFTYIKVIKMYAWEKPFAKNVQELRQAEHRVLSKSVLAQSVSMGSSMFVSLFASCLTFIGFVGSGNNLTPTQAFTFVSLMNIVQGSMMTIPFALKSLSEMFVTNARMKEIMLMESMTSHKTVTSDPSVVMEMNHASFSWVSKKYTKAENDKEMNGVFDDKGDKVESEKLKLKDNEDKTTSLGQIYTGPILKEITFTLKMGKMIGVCGPFGCGKSSLINACLGRMSMMSGTVAISKQIGYVSQEAWITNDSIRNNILFGDDYDADRYKEIIEACALAEDLKSFPAGDTTEVGERGATLSGGQKQRISLARAVYSRSPIVVLDDPLSAVDVHVGQHIFQNCILGLLKGRALLFTTQQLEFLKECDEIMVMCDGSVIEQGSYNTLVSKNDGELVSLLAMLEKEKEKSHGNRNDGGREGDETVEGGEEETSKDREGGLESGDGRIENYHRKDKDVELVQDEELEDETDLARLIREEEMEEGPIRLSTLGFYIRCAGGYAKTAFVLFCFCLPVAGVTTANWYLYYWLKQGGGDVMFESPDNTTVTSWRVVDHPDRTTYLLIYAAFIPILIILLVIRAICLTKTTLCASSNLHGKAFARILHCSSSFFDSTPVGRIINRFSADLDEIDMRLPMNLEIFLTNCLQVVAVVAMIIYVSPYFALASVPLGVVFYFLMHVFHSCIHELKNLDNVTRSPVLSHMGATIQGLATVHTYNKMQAFVTRHCQLLNANAVAVFLFFAANRWLAFWLDMISAVIIFITGLLILVTYDLMNPGLAGLALSFAIQMSGLFQFTTRLAVETEARFASVERLQEYANTPDQEILEDDEAATKTHSSSSSSSSISSPAWPSNGEIQLKNVNLRYKPGLSLALNDISLHIKPRESIGIVGRTGAGKTSLSTVLFRLTSLESGSVSIDNVDISTVPLQQLRSSLSVIPQDPVLFAGTLRYNLDPVHQFSDADIWKVLERCRIQDMVKSLDSQLDTEVRETGSNFSVGERQLLCLSRALLRNSKILILDEATTAIDVETRGLIQSALKEAFSECTMLIIAHRLTSITNCDRVVVMENGQIKECDTPASLLSDLRSRFKAMYDAALSSQS